MIRQRLDALADTGATFEQVQLELKGHRGLSQKDYDELWLYAWALVKTKAARVATSVTTSEDAEIYGFVGEPD
jgi:hypothetical protein